MTFWINRMPVGADRLLTKRAANCSTAVWLFLASQIAICPCAVAATDGKRLAPIDVVVHEIQESRNHIKSDAYTCDVDFTCANVDHKLPPGAQRGLPCRVNATEKVIEKGDWRRAWIDRTLIFDDGGPPCHFSTRSILGQHYSAFWLVGTSNPQQFLHNSPHDLSDEEELTLALGNPVRQCGFGLGVKYFDQLLSESSPKKEWRVSSAKQKDGEDAIEIAVQFGAGDRAVVLIDPNRGYLVRQATSYAPDGSLTYETDVDVQQVGNGIWFPSHVDQRTFVHSVLATRRSLTIHDVKVNQPTPDDLFLIESMELTDGIDCIQHRPDGSLAAFRVRSGKLIPLDAYLTSRLKAARAGGTKGP